MAGREYSTKVSVGNLLEMVTVTSGIIDELVIVNKTILSKLLYLIPADSLKTFVEESGEDLPRLGDPRLPIWLKAKRSNLKLTQKGLAERLRQLDLKVHPSDIGNLETGKRKDLYTPERVDKILREIDQLLIKPPVPKKTPV